MRRDKKECFGTKRWRARYVRVSEFIGESHDPAVVWSGGVLSYGDLWGQVGHWEGLFNDWNLEAGDRLGISCSTNPDWPSLILAAVKCGLTLCPLNPRFPESKVVALKESLRMKRLITEETFPSIPRDYPVRPLGGLESLEVLDLKRPLSIMMTSGSTGNPKAAVHSLGNHCYSALGANEHLPLNPGCRWLLSLPLFHVGAWGIIFRCFLAGAAVVVPDREEKGLSELLSKYDITHISMVHTQLWRWLEGGCELHSLKAILLGGGPFSPQLVFNSLKRKAPLLMSYGLTEMSSQVCTSQAGHPFTCGKVLKHREIALSSKGEILVRGDCLFQGYLNGDSLELPVDQEGWFPTGDLGRMSPGGRLSILGRKDNLFISGGENIQPEEIEQALLQIAGVRQAIVLPLADEEFGQVPQAILDIHGGGMPPSNQIQKLLEEKLPRFKIPKLYHPWPKDQSLGLKPSRAALAQAITAA